MKKSCVSKLMGSKSYINKISSLLERNGALIVSTKSIKIPNGETCNREEVKNLLSNIGYKSIKVIKGEEEIEYYFIKS